MSTWNVTDARARLPEILQRVESGEEVTLTRHGRSVAVIVRPDVLRARRSPEAIDAGEEISRMLREIAGQERADGNLTVERADEQVAAIRADRDLA